MAADWLTGAATVADGLGSLGGGASGPAISDSLSGPVTVNVGGLNVPAFPDFPARFDGQAVGTITPATSGIDRTMILIAAIVAVAVVVKAVKK